MSEVAGLNALSLLQLLQRPPEEDDRGVRPRGVLLAAIHSDRWETAEEVSAHAAKQGHTLLVIRDPDGRLARLLDARRTLEVFPIDAGRYHGRIAAKIGTPNLRNALDALLAGNPIDPSETKSFGCSIDRSWNKPK